MNKKPSVRHTRRSQQYNSPPRRNAMPTPLVCRRSFAYRQKRMRQRRIALICVGIGIVLLIALVVLLVLPKDPATVPAVNQSEVSSEIISSEVISSEITSSEVNSEIISSDPVDPEWERAYQVASQVKLINFDHPNYDEPAQLAELDDLLSDTVTINSGANKLTPEAAQALKELFDAAEADGITTYIVNSAYRDRDLQQSFWDNRLAQDPHYGDDVYANPVKTVPATASEHCTGLAVDILCDSIPHGTQDYKDTKEAQWLADNAYKYGFILRYPDGKQSVTGVMFEPWHYRYVGKEAAADIFASGLCLEEYLASFDLPLQATDVNAAY